WIGGKWRKSSDGARFDVIDPATENTIASVASATVEDAKTAVDAASGAFEGWAARKPRERAEVLRKAYDLILKESERFAKLTMLALMPVLAEAGVPAGVVNVIPSRRSAPVVSAMLHDPRVRVMSFTGSTEVGRKLLHEAADNVVKPAMELGGNAPFIVFEDADIDAAIEGAMIAKMRNMGEACTAANRFYVQEKVHDEFAHKLTEKMAALKMGNGLQDGVALGPLVNADARKKVVSLVEDAVGKGAKILTGGKAPG